MRCYLGIFLLVSVSCASVICVLAFFFFLLVYLIALQSAGVNINESNANQVPSLLPEDVALKFLVT